MIWANVAFVVWMSISLGSHIKARKGDDLWVGSPAAIAIAAFALLTNLAVVILYLLKRGA